MFDAGAPEERDSACRNFVAKIFDSREESGLWRLLGPAMRKSRRLPGTGGIPERSSTVASAEFAADEAGGGDLPEVPPEIEIENSNSSSQPHGCNYERQATEKSITSLQL